MAAAKWRVYAEKVARLEKEAQSLKRISEEVFRVQKQLDTEKVAREAASGQLQSDLQQLLSKSLTHVPHHLHRVLHVRQAKNCSMQLHVLIVPQTVNSACLIVPVCSNAIQVADHCISMYLDAQPAHSYPPATNHLCMALSLPALLHETLPLPFHRHRTAVCTVQALTN